MASPTCFVTTTAPPPERRRRLPIWPIVVLCGAAFAAYHDSFHGPFVFDDASSIVTNPTIRHVWPLSGPLTPPTTNVTAQGRPILNLSLAINHAIGGTAVEGYHIGNLIIHMLAGLTLFGLVRRTTQLRTTAATRAAGSRAAQATFDPMWFALAVALLWVVHPLQTESVTYIIQRAESLMGLFYLLTLYCFVRGAERSATGEAFAEGETRARSASGWHVLAVLSCIAGMATKEVMATAPLMAVVFDRTFLSGSVRAALRTRRLFYSALFATWLLLAWLIVQTGGNRGGSVGFGVGVAWWDYWLTQFRAVAHYLRLALWPSPLVFEYGSFWIRNLAEIGVDIVIVTTLLAATLIGLWRRTVPGFLGAWFFGILAPTSLAPGTTQMIVEHRMYLPLAAVIALLGIVVQRSLGGRGRWLLSGALGAVTVAFVFLTVRRNHDYRSDVALWSDTIAKSPGNPLAHFMLAGACERVGDATRATTGYEDALRLKPDFSIGHEHFGELLLRQSRYMDAIEHFEAALRLQPEFGDAHMNLGNALLATGRSAEALPHFAQAARLTPEVAETHYNFGHALASVGKTTDAIAEFETALRHPAGDPAVNVAAHHQLANLLATSGRPADAIPHYEAALRARPDLAEAHHNLGSAYFELGRLVEAARQYEETLRLDPNFPHARDHLALVRKQIRESK